MKTIVELSTSIKNYIVNKIRAVESNVAPVETSASASTRAYTIGKQLILNDVLYKAKTAISVGDPLVVDTNIEVVDDVITQLDSLKQTLENEIGDLTDLDTTVKTDLVAAVNEVKASAGGALYFSGQACSALTGDFCTISNAKITANHVVAEAVFANPSAITTDVTWTTASGSLKLNGTCSTATTVNIVLVKKTN